MCYKLPYDDSPFKCFLEIATCLYTKIREPNPPLQDIKNLPKVNVDSTISQVYRKAAGCVIYKAETLINKIPNYFGEVKFIFVYSNISETPDVACAYYDDPNSQLNTTTDKLSFNTYFYLTYDEYARPVFQFINANESDLTATIVHELTHSYDNFIAKKSGVSNSTTHNETEETKNEIYQKFSTPIHDDSIDEIAACYLEALYYFMMTEKNAHVAEYRALCELYVNGRVLKNSLNRLSSKVENVLEALEKIDLESNYTSIKKSFDTMEFESVFVDSYTKNTDMDIVQDITTILKGNLIKILEAFKSLETLYKIEI